LKPLERYAQHLVKLTRCVQQSEAS